MHAVAFITHAYPNQTDRMQFRHATCHAKPYKPFAPNMTWSTSGMEAHDMIRIKITQTYFSLTCLNDRIVHLTCIMHTCNQCGPVLLRSCCAISVVRGLHGKWRKLDELGHRGQFHQEINPEETWQIPHGGIPDFEDHVQPRDSEATERWKEGSPVEEE